VFLRLLAGILLSYVIVIGFGDTRIGDPARVVLFGILLALALRLRGLAKLRWWTIGVTVLLVIISVLAKEFTSPTVTSGVVGACTFVLISGIIAAIVWEIIQLRDIDTSVVLGVLCVYLLLALFFAAVHQILAAFSSHYVNGAPQPPSAADLLYFSVITLTTVGYGDITPAAESARAVAVLEALTGQLYLVSVVAAVVGGWQGRRRSAGDSDAHPE